VTSLLALSLGVLWKFSRPDPELLASVRLCQHEERDLPEVGRTGVKVQCEDLSGRTDGDLTEILRVVLLVCGRHLAFLTRGGILLHQRVLLDFGVSSDVAGELVVQNGLAKLFDNVGHEVRSIESRSEVVFSEQIDVGLETRALVLGVVNKLHARQVVLHGG
jgi:hypothetical protein